MGEYSEFRGNGKEEMLDFVSLSELPSLSVI